MSSIGLEKTIIKWRSRRIYKGFKFEMKHGEKKLWIVAGIPETHFHPQQILSAGYKIVVLYH